MSMGALSGDFVVGVDTSEHGPISCSRFRADIKARKGGDSLAEACKVCQRWAVYEPGPRGQSEDLDERSPSPRWLAWLKGVETG